jgi:hypothetical protein
MRMWLKSGKQGIYVEFWWKNLLINVRFRNRDARMASRGSQGETGCEYTAEVGQYRGQ